MMRPKQAGFTLIELIVVIVVLGILMAMAMPKLSSLDKDAKKAAVQGGIAALQSAAQMTYGITKTTSTLQTIMANTVLSDPLTSFSQTICARDLPGGASTIDGYYGTVAASALLASASIDGALCSG